MGKIARMPLRPVDRDRDEDRIHEGNVIRREDDGAHRRHVLDPVEPDPEERPGETPHARPADLEEPGGNGAHRSIVTRSGHS